MTEGAPFFFNDDDDDHHGVDEAVKTMERLASEFADPIVPKPPVHHTSAGFVHPIRNVCVGVCPKFAVAMSGPRETLKRVRELWVQQERVGVYMSRKQYFEAYKGQWSREKLEVELAQLEIIASVDITLKEPMERLMVPLRQTLTKLVEKQGDNNPPAAAAAEQDFKTIPIVKRKNPTGKVDCSTEKLAPLKEDQEQEEQQEPEWVLHICPVPVKAARRTPLGWKPLTGLKWSVKPGTVPVVCFNETHLVALYSRPSDTDHVTLECGTIVRKESNGNYVYQRQWIASLPCPAGAQDFSALARLSPGGTLTLALCNIMYVISIADSTRMLVMRMQPHVVVTALWFCDASGGLTWGTHCGESFYCNASTLDDMQTILTPLEEPILAVQRDAANGGRWMVNTWMSVVGRLSAGAVEFKALPMERPLAIAARGPLLFVLTKYGKLDVYRPGQEDTPLRGLLRVEKRPPMVTQYAYDGLATVGEKGLAALTPSGQVHYFEWE